MNRRSFFGVAAAAVAGLVVERATAKPHGAAFVTGGGAQFANKPPALDFSETAKIAIGGTNWLSAR